LTLNRPSKLNALNFEMLQFLRREFMAAASDESVKAIMITAVPGRAFCAGGDISEVLEGTEADPTFAERFLLEEYKMDALIHRISRDKPVVTVADGITMGGGAGVFMGGSVRLVTERALFAMPECAIALVPDVGSTYFLTQVCPPDVGLYAALTGARLGAADLLGVGLANAFCEAAAAGGLLGELRAAA
ncbi:unnamed protein product, partial [Heterosigma akashiwo]